MVRSARREQAGVRNALEIIERAVGARRTSTSRALRVRRQRGESHGIRHEIRLERFVATLAHRMDWSNRRRHLLFLGADSAPLHFRQSIVGPALGVVLCAMAGVAIVWPRLNHGLRFWRHFAAQGLFRQPAKAGNTFRGSTLPNNLATRRNSAPASVGFTVSLGGGLRRGMS
jgi:hypothetical protein